MGFSKALLLITTPLIGFLFEIQPTIASCRIFSSPQSVKVVRNEIQIQEIEAGYEEWRNVNIPLTLPDPSRPKDSAPRSAVAAAIGSVVRSGLARVGLSSKFNPSDPKSYQPILPEFREGNNKNAHRTSFLFAGTEDRNLIGRIVVVQKLRLIQEKEDQVYRGGEVLVGQVRSVDDLSLTLVVRGQGSSFKEVEIAGEFLIQTIGKDRLFASDLTGEIPFRGKTDDLVAFYGDRVPENFQGDPRLVSWSRLEGISGMFAEFKEYDSSGIPLHTRKGRVLFNEGDGFSVLEGAGIESRSIPRFSTNIASYGVMISPIKKVLVPTSDGGRQEFKGFVLGEQANAFGQVGKMTVYEIPRPDAPRTEWINHASYPCVVRSSSPESGSPTRSVVIEQPNGKIIQIRVTGNKIFYFEPEGEVVPGVLNSEPLRGFDP